MGRGDGGAELFQRQHMGVEPAAADDIAAGRRQRDFAAAREQWPGQQDRGANPGTQVRIEVGGADFLGVDRKRVAALPFGGRADRANEFDQRFGVANRGTFSSVTGCSVSSAAAMIGSAAFLLPDGSMVPVRRRPPSTIY